jgi:molybdopterin/thiamine biosynthesis adenylyltransferase
VSVPPDYFARVAERVNLSLLATMRVLIVGAGAVGSQIADELAKSGIGRIALIDGDHLDETNRARHVLPAQYVGMNKAVALAHYLKEQVPNLETRALSHDIDDSVSEDQLEWLFADVELIVAATGERDPQRRIGRAALALEVPAIFPGLHGHDGGEVFLQLTRRRPCYMCFDAFRIAGAPLEAVAGVNADTLGIVQLAVYMTLGLLDRGSEYARLLARMSGSAGVVPQAFVISEYALGMPPVSKQVDCPACGGHREPSAGDDAPMRPANTHAQSGRAPQPNPPPSPWAGRQTPAGPTLEELRQRVRSTAYSALGIAAGIVVITTIIIPVRVGSAGAYILAATWIVGLWILYVETMSCFEAWEAFKRARNIKDHELRQQERGGGGKPA